jgi:hypothetical protein
MIATLDIGQPTGNVVVGPSANEISIVYACGRFKEAIHVARDGGTRKRRALTTDWWIQIDEGPGCDRLLTME